MTDLKSLMTSMRSSKDPPKTQTIAVRLPTDEKSAADQEKGTIDRIIKDIREYKPSGCKKKVYKADPRNQFFMEQLKPCLGVTESDFINYLINRFISQTPEIKTIIENNIKNL